MSPHPYTPARRHQALVVVEFGCDRLAWRRGLASAGAAATSVVQRADESATEHMQRALESIEGTSSLVLVAGRRNDGVALDARARLLRAFAEHSAGEGRSILLEGAGIARFAMEALTEMASDQLRSSGIAVLGPSELEPRRIAA